MAKKQSLKQKRKIRSARPRQQLPVLFDPSEKFTTEESTMTSLSPKAQAMLYREETQVARTLVRARQIDKLPLSENQKTVARLAYLILTLSTYVAAIPSMFAFFCGLSEADAERYIMELVELKVLKFMKYSSETAEGEAMDLWVFTSPLRAKRADVDELHADKAAMDLEFTWHHGNLPVTLDIFDPHLLLSWLPVEFFGGRFGDPWSMRFPS